MKIFPLPGVVQLKLEEATAGALITSSRDSAVEFAEVVAVGEKTLFKYPANGSSTSTSFNGVAIAQPLLKKGDKVFVKAWAIDIINHEGIKYFFVDLNSKGILAIVK